MAALVVDSSIIVKWLNSNDEQHLEKADKILSHALTNTIELIAPELAKYEVGNVLLIKKKLPVEQVELSIHALYAYPIQFVSETEELAYLTYKIASKLNITY